MMQRTEHVYVTQKALDFLKADKKIYIGSAAVLLFYLGACLVAFVDYVINKVDIIHMGAVGLLFAIGVFVAWYLGDGYTLSKHAVRLEEILMEVDKQELSWKELSRVYKRKNTVRLVDRMLHKGIIQGIRINMDTKTVFLEKNTRPGRNIKRR